MYVLFVVFTLSKQSFLPNESEAHTVSVRAYSSSYRLDTHTNCYVVTDLEIVRHREQKKKAILFTKVERKKSEMLCSLIAKRGSTTLFLYDEAPPQGHLLCIRICQSKTAFFD